jgi:LAS superfamily LD-carboxypeptidase LdcB
VAAAVLTPVASGAQEPDPEQQREEVRAQQAQIALEIDALEAQDAEIQKALADLEANVATQQAELAEAEQAQRDSEAAVVAAEAAVVDAQRRIDQLNVAADQLVVDSFVHPPSDDVLDAFRAGSLTESAVKGALIQIQADQDADLLTQLNQAHQQLEADEAAKEAAAAQAVEARDEAAGALAEVEAALAQQQEFAAQVDARINARLAEAESLKQLDASLSEQIAREQAALAAQLAQLAAQPPPTGGGPASIEPVPGGLSTVTCPAGGSITVSATIADGLAALLEASYADGVAMCGGGYRDPEAQIQLRREHCGTSYYAIYEMPASQCTPPTAQPGTSLHEQGLAVDFTCNGAGTVSNGDECWVWLSAHAADYGLYNLPSEPWHWSTTGG